MARADSKTAVTMSEVGSSDMPSEWRTMSLREAGVDLIDCDHRTPQAASTGYPYIAIPQLKDGRIELGDVRRITKADYEDWTRKLRPRQHDVIVVRRCSSGDSAVVPKGLECAIGQNLIVLRANGRDVHPEFLRWLVRGAEWWEQVRKFMNVGAVFNSLKCKEIPNFEVVVPPLEDQDQIARTLTGLDDKIVLLRETNATLEAIAQALFKSWFVDFDPVRARAEGRDPEGVPPEVADLFPSEFKDSELGAIPKGWRAGSVDEEFNLVMGQSPPGCSYNEEGDGVPFFQGRTDFGFRFPTNRMYCSAPTRFALPGDTLVSVRAPVGDINMALERCCIGRGVASIRHKSGALSFTFYAMREEENQFAHFESDGTIFGSIGKKDFHALRLVLPPPDVIEAFESFAAPLDERVKTNESEMGSLIGLRDTLLPRLMSGKLRISDLLTESA